MSMLNGEKKVLVISGLIFLLTGIMMCVWPVGTTGVMCILAGLALLGSGGWKIFGYFKKKDFSLVPRWDFLMAAMLAMLGIVMVFRTVEVAALLPVILGGIVLVNSTFQTQTALELKQKKYEKWWYHLAAAGICGALALAVILIPPLGGYRVLSILMGIAFIADGVADLWTALYLQERLKKLNAQ